MHPLLDAARKHAQNSFDAVKHAAPALLLDLAARNLDEFVTLAAASHADDWADSKTVLTKFYLGSIVLHHLLNKSPEVVKDRDLHRKFSAASVKQATAQMALDRIILRLSDSPARLSQDTDAVAQPTASLQDRLRALKDAGIADPALLKRTHNPKAASIAVSSPVSASTLPSPSPLYEFVNPSTLGPPSPGPSSHATRRSHPPPSSSSSSSSFVFKSEDEITHSFPSLDEFESAFPAVSTSTTPSVNGFTFSPSFAPQQPASSFVTQRSSRSQSVASTSRLTSAAPSTSASPTLSDRIPRPLPIPSTSAAATSAAAAAAATAAAAAATTRIHKPELPKSTNITPRHLKSILDSNLKVLLLDVRTREEFDRKHINAEGDAVACIEPSILLRDIVSGPAIESALIVGPNQEHAVFRNRDKFDSVAIYDDSSDEQGPATSPASRLIRAIYEEAFTRKLKTAPYFLTGGLRAWELEFGSKGVESSVGKSISSLEGLEKLPLPLLSPAISQATPTPLLENHLPSVPSVSDLQPSSPIPPSTSASPLSNGIAQTSETTVPSSDDRAGTPQPTSGSDAQESPVAETVRRLNRKATISRPPSAGPMSAYRRPIHDIPMSPTTSNAPIQYPSPIRAFAPSAITQSTASLASSLLSNSDSLVQAPPAASVSSSPLARRRSDYLEQSQMPYSGAPAATAAVRAAIDYPQLALPQLIRPPPATAAPLERQDQRPRIAPIAQNVPPKPPLIASDYPVTTWSDMQVATSGLKNLGNTCYMNSTVQCLSATVPFARFFTEGRWKGAVNLVNPLGTKGQLANAFATLLHEMWHGDLPYRSPYQFRKTICGFAKQFANSEQHDSQEFLSSLLDGLHEDLNRILSKPNTDQTPEHEAELEMMPVQIASEQEWQIYQMRNDSLIVDYFQGQFRNRVQCLTCHKTSTTYNSFMYLSLPIPAGRGVSKVTLNQCLDHFVREEVIDKENAWNCPNCKCLRRATTQLSLSRLPPVLLIHLKRFSVKGPFTDKLETVVDFPQRALDLTNYMPPPLPPGTARPPRSQPLRTDDPRLQVPPYKYDLYGVTNHYGTLTGGHYTAFIASQGRWLHCDDSRISEADPQSLTVRLETARRSRRRR